MKQRITFFLLAGLLFWASRGVAQVRDSTLVVGGLSGDTLHIIHENIPRSRFWGNSWYGGLSYNLSRSHEFTANFGRTFGNGFYSGAGFNLRMNSWGVGYSRYYKGVSSGQTVSAFGEISNFFLPPGTIRLDYIYDFTGGNHLLRPAIGLNLFAVDLMYCYSFKIIGPNNPFRHGFTAKFKFYFGQKHWQKNYPSRC
ncbi:MAG: hypothetical protein H6581_03055 [Bacteroidia bacterium]|nr:hypothetical protein [Bacteroidia bacterium]